nr:toll/interleukin-1 receptor domain-containing protein [Roseobacter ponti]
MSREFGLELWDDTKLQAGDDWKEEIAKEIEDCSAAILLVSADFPASDFIVTEELPPLLEAAKKRVARIIPTITKACLFPEIDELSKFQAINPPSKALITMTEGEAEEAYLKLASTIKTLL